MRSVLILILTAIFFTSCSNFSTHIVRKKNLPPIENDKPIYVFHKQYDELPDSSEYVGDILVDMNLQKAYAGGGLPSMRGMLSVLEDDIKKYGANFLMIDEIGNSSEDMLNGKIYLVPDFDRTEFNEKTLENELDSRQLNPLEGIYIEQFLNPYTNYLVTLKFGILKESETEFKVIYLSGFESVRYLLGLTMPHRTWVTGDIYGYLNTTEKENLYEAQIYKINKSLNLNGTAKVDNKNLRIYSNDVLTTYVKVYPDSGRYEIPVGSLTGFALDDKSILTCYHGLTDSDLEVFVKGINGDFNKKYKAEIVSKDKQLDLAVIRLVDSTIKLSKVAFPKAAEEKSISEKVFVLGYPMSTIMGDDIKLTDGLISSTTGIGGNLKQYQISAPIQPGNSGSPCFDNNGNFIGVVSSGIAKADNVGYTLKGKYVEKFLEDQNIILETESQDNLSDLPLVSKVKKLKKSIYLIELTDTEPPKSKNTSKRRRRR